MKSKKLLSLLATFLFLVIFGISGTDIQNSNLIAKYFLLPSQVISPSLVQPTQKQILGVSDEASAIVKRVVDGDTIELENGQKVRYIGVNTPESADPRRGVQCFGKEASQYNKSLVEGKKVRLVKDISETDSFGRLLRYVYIVPQSESENEIFVNEKLVRDGYAHAVSYPPDIAFQSLFQEAEKDARVNNRGLWGAGCSGKKT